MADLVKIEENIKSSKKRNGGYDKKYVGLPPQDLPYSQKKSNGFAWAKECMDYYSDSKSIATDKGRLIRLSENYEIASGRWDMNKAREVMNRWNYDGLKDLDLSNTKVTHYPIINQIVSSLVGDHSQRYFNPQVADMSRGAVSEKKKMSEELIMKYIQEELLAPIAEKAKLKAEKFVEEINKQFEGVSSELSDSIQPEQAEQMKAQRDQAIDQVRSKAEEEVKAQTPEEILAFINGEYKSPREKAFQKLLDALVRELNISMKVDEAFEHGIISGEIFFRTGIRHGKPFFDCINPVKFRYWKSSYSERVEDAEAMIYEDYIRVSDLYHRFGDEIKPSDDKKIKSLLTNGEATYTDEERRLLLDFAVESGSKLNWHTKEGQEDIKQIYGDPEINKLLPSLSNELIRWQHIVWKSRRKLKRVKRSIDGKEVIFWADSSYKMDEIAGDIEVATFSVPEYWEGNKIGVGSEALFLGVKPVPNQYRSVSDPYTVKAPYFGGKINSFGGNSANTSLVDLGKPWQFKFNVEMSRLEELQETNVGKVMAMTLRNLPEGYTWQEWFTMLKKGKVAILEDNDGMGGFDPALFRSIDLGQMNDIAGTINLLNYYQNNLAVSMLYNPSRLGQVSPYITNATNDQNIQQSFNQTRKHFDSIDAISQAALNGLLNAAKVAYRDNPDYILGIVNNLEFAQLIKSDDTFWSIDTGVFINSGSEQTEDIRTIKAQALAMIQNSQDIDLVIQLQLAKSVEEVRGIGNKFKADLEKVRAQEMQIKEQANQIKQQEIQQQKEIESAKMQMEMQKHEAEMAQKNIYARMEAVKLKNMMDVNQNNISDQLEKYMLERQDKKYEVDLKYALKMKELEIRTEELKLEYYKSNMKQEGDASSIESKEMISMLNAEIEKLKLEAKREMEELRLSFSQTPEVPAIQQGSEIVGQEMQRGFDISTPSMEDAEIEDPFE